MVHYQQLCFIPNLCWEWWAACMGMEYGKQVVVLVIRSVQLLSTPYQNLLTTVGKTEKWSGEQARGTVMTADLQQEAS